MNVGDRIRFKDGREGVIDNVQHPAVTLGCGCCSDYDYDVVWALDVVLDDGTDVFDVDPDDVAVL